MNINWKKTAVVILDTAISAYLVLAITAFNKPDGQATVCSEVKINIQKDVTDGFLNAEEVKKFLEYNKVYPLAKPLKEINTRHIEEVLRQSPFVETAECYKTQGGNICITLKQKTPILRVKADNGDDYYIDNHGSQMSNTRYPSNLIVATGHISRQYAQKVLTPIGNMIVNNPFWQNQIEQINVLADGTVEIVPRVGEHIIYLGRPTNIENKLQRLEKFYRYGLSQAGWNKYSYISLEFDNQIICKKKQKHS
ncbi:MAG: cell division protein FtsQ [Prevotella sp.]|nr:cell division protein FtsQ [Prevotella sp.]